MNFKATVFLVVIAVFMVSCATVKKPELPETPVLPVTPAIPKPVPAKIALVLGAGAAKGFAHIGVIKVIEANKIPIHMVVGTSAGSVVGSFYAYGYNAQTLQRIALSIQKSDVFDLALPTNGFIKGEKLEQFVNKYLMNSRLENLRTPFWAVATNVITGEEVAFNNGNAGIAVRASCSIPGVFQPANIGGKCYVDGGVVSPVAVDVARRYGADIVIAVDVSGGVSNSAPGNTMETILQSIDIMYSKIADFQLMKADVVIKPRVGHIGSSEIEKGTEAILEGEKAATAALPAIQAIVAKLKRDGRL